MRFLRRHHWLFLTLLLGLAAAPEAARADEAALLAAINAERASHGLSGLRADAQLRQAARAHAEDLPRCGQLSHTGCDGSDLRQRLGRSGYPFALAAENIALGQPDGATALREWLASPGHRDNLLRPGLREAGLARGELGGQPLWVLVLGTRQ